MKVRIISLFLSLFLIVSFLFSIFYKIQTFYIGELIEYSGSQIIQIKKESNEFYQNQKIYIKDSKMSYSTYIQSIEEDGNFYYLTLGKYFSKYKEIDHIWIYNKKISLGEYLLKSIIDFK